MRHNRLLLLWILLLPACIAQSGIGVISTNVGETPIPSSTPALTPTSKSPSDCQSIVGSGLPSENLRKTHIIYQSLDQAGSTQIWVVTLENGERTLLQGYPGTVSGLGFLPDGKQFLIAIGYDNKAWLGDIYGSPPLKIDLTNTLLASFRPYTPLWCAMLGGVAKELNSCFPGYYGSPDGEKIAVWNGGDQELVMLDRKSQAETGVISTNMQDNIDGQWTPDSQWFIFAYTHSDSGSYFSQILRTNKDGSKVEELLSKFDRYSFHTIALSPDGKKITFSASSGASKYLGVLWLDVSKYQFYPLAEGISGSPLYAGSTVWSPDSEWIAIITGLVQEDILVLNINSGAIYCITDDNLSENLMDWQ